MIAGCEFGSQTHNELAKQATDAILKRLYQCTTLQPTDAILIIECFKTALLSERAKDLLVDAVSSKTTLDFFVIDDPTKDEDSTEDEDGNQECVAFCSFLADSDIIGLAVATSQHEAIQVLAG